MVAYSGIKLASYVPGENSTHTWRCAHDKAT